MTTTAQPNERDREVAVAAARGVAESGFVVGCCCMSQTDADEFASYIVQDIATYRAEIEAARDKQIGQHLRQAALGKWSAATPMLWEIINAIESGEIDHGE
jgi:hypothetical protein